jgi:glucose-1-phosphate thymidylyltransferase
LIAGGAAQDELSDMAGGVRHLMPVANRPLLDYGLDALRKAGVDEIAVVVSADTGDQLRDALAARNDDQLPIGVIQLDRAPTLPQALVAASDFIGSSRCMVHIADGLVASPIEHLYEEIQNGDSDALVLVRSDADELEGQGNVRPLRLVTDRPVPPADQALTGVFAFSPVAIEKACRLGASDAGHGVHELLAALTDAGKSVEARPVTGAWKYSGDVDGLLEANRLVLDELHPSRGDADLSAARIEGRVSVHPTAVLDRTTVRGPAVIGPGAVLVDTFVGPYTAIGTDVRLEGTEIEHSIVLPRATIRHLGKRLEDSLVGQDAMLVRDFAMPASLRLRVGRGAAVSLA